MIIIVAGVSGSGKSTVGALLAGRLGWAFADGDSFHPAANVTRMAAGIPLTDDDRWPWLAAIGAWMDEQAAAGHSAVVACSALKRAYREVLLNGRPEARLAFLDVGHDMDATRLTARHGHFFPPRLLDSQFDDLEVPRPEEGALVVPANGTPEELAGAIADGLGLTAAKGGRAAPGPA
ncbi:MAG: gluconokinase [Streptosporangiaceae bacterium]|jgi:carbohydrate kinase (thermoresistant glucokinase family)